MDFAINLFIIIADQFMLFIVNMVVARHYGEELFGNYTVATNALLLLGTLLTLGIDSIITYYVPKFYTQGKYEEIRYLITSIRRLLTPLYLGVITLGLLLTFSLIAICHTLPKLTLFDISHPFYLFIWGTVAISLYNICIQLFRTIDYMRTAVIMSFFRTILYFLLSIVIFFYVYPLFFQDDKRYFPHVMLIGFIASYLIIVLASLFLQQRTNLIHAEKEALFQPQWKMKIYGYTLQNLNKYVFSAVPLIIIEWIGTNEQEVGLFSAVVSIISIGLMAIMPIGILIGPEISAAFADNQKSLKKVMHKYFWITFIMSLVIIIITGFSAKYILILYKSNFIAALPYTYFCLINVLSFAISMLLSKMIQYSPQGSKIGAKLTIYLFLLQLVACWIFIKWLGLIGAIICYVGINIVSSIALAILAVRIYRSDCFGPTVL